MDQTLQRTLAYLQWENRKRNYVCDIKSYRTAKGYINI